MEIPDPDFPNNLLCGKQRGFIRAGASRTGTLACPGEKRTGKSACPTGKNRSGRWVRGVSLCRHPVPSPPTPHPRSGAEGRKKSFEDEQSVFPRIWSGKRLDSLFGKRAKGHFLAGFRIDPEGFDC